MGRNFEKYLEESTKEIMEIVSSPDVGEEKTVLLMSFQMNC